MLTEKENEILGKLKSELSDNQTKRDIKLISAVFADIECRFGSHVFSFMIHYYSKLIEHCDLPCIDLDDDSSSSMELASYMAGSFDEFGYELNQVIDSEVYGKCQYDDLNIRHDAVNTLDEYFEKLNSTIKVEV